MLTRLSWSFLCQRRETSNPSVFSHEPKSHRFVCVWLTCQVLRPWKKKYSAKPHTTAVKRIHTSARHLILSPLRSWAQTENCELQRSQTCLLLSPGASHMRRVTKHTNLHDDIKGKVEQQVTDGDGQQVRGKVVGSLYEAVGSPAER